MIGDRLSELRKDAGLTQDELGEILKVNKHSVSSYERDRSEPPDDVKIRIAEYFNVSTDYLLGLTDEPNPSYNNNSHRVLRLPKSFPREALPELKSYCEFLIYKNSRSNP